MRMNKVIEEDCSFVAKSDCIDWAQMRGKSVLVTGATGLLGSQLVRSIVYVDARLGLDIKVTALVRDAEKAREVLGLGASVPSCLSILVGDVVDLPVIDGPIDYVVHAASPTASGFFMSNPVETLRTAIVGTDNVLRVARDKGAEGFVYLSSMEIYGTVSEDVPLTEEVLGLVDPLSTRSCYPEGKRACEALVSGYASEYDLRAMSVRLAQTFGPGVPAGDKRVFAMMARCAMRGEDIVLQTRGESRNPYLYTAQAVEAILCVLLRGEAGRSYNVANPSTYCSVAEMGEIVAREIAGDAISVRFAEDGDISKYPPTRFWRLDTSRIESLGWRPQGTLADMYRRMICVMKDDGVTCTASK